MTKQQPTRNDKLEYIKKKCIEANPGIMPDIYTIKRGDLIEHKISKDVYELISVNKTPDLTHGEYLEFVRKDDFNSGLYSDPLTLINKIYNFLPRDITLCDFMMALDRSTIDINYEWFVSMRGDFILMYCGEIYETSSLEWNERQNALHLQSDPFINWAYETLGSKTE